MSILMRSFYLKCLTPFAPLSKIHPHLFKRYSQAVFRLKMNEAIVLYEEGSKKFEMSLRYANPELNIDRNFNFERQVDEPINNFLQRIDKNISNFLMKKVNRKKKRQKKDETPVEIPENNVENNRIRFVKDQVVLNGELPCKSILESSSDVKLIIFDTEYVLKQNVPFITKIELPSSILIDFPTYPSKLEGTNIDKTKSTFNWYKNKTRDWIHVGEGFLYLPKKSDLGHRLKVSCVPRNNTQCGPIVEIVSNDIVQIGPGPCPFDTRHAFTNEKLSGKSFRVTSYNILANLYSETSLSKDTLYPYCPQYALSMDYRKLLILKELIGFNSDIICLQEVDSKVYTNDLMMSLNELNYDGVLNLKNDMREGLAIFYNRERFNKLICNYSVMSQGINLEKFNTLWSKIENTNVKEIFMNRNTIIQMIALQSKENPEILIIGNTHLYFKPDADHIRLLQSYYGLAYLHSFAKKMKEENPSCNVSILYCGDFNSTPADGVYELMTQKFIPEDYCDWTTSPVQEHVKNVSIKHDLNLASACGTPKYTNYTATFSGCLDYIFYQTDHLKVEQVIPMPSEEELTAYTGLPSVVSPSDHISLCVDLKWSK
ncbi:2',5'-phosphodiesterase 12 [Ceratina calcarata]|uniref:2',5'-phosphodiesterase 12 n=1 Tax=Ceratina calcarata TaxID=156304 RepID=A0AAJ7SC78_9HYME|nr:2',5'-phosphodiesterase 12 [Ceratina calcarata]